MIKWLNRLLRRQIDCARDYETANRIVRCFDGIRLDRSRFVFGSQEIKDGHGENYFYPASEIDKVIANINALTDELKRGRPLKRNLTPEEFEEQSK